MLQGLQPLYLGLLSSQEVGVASTYHRQDMLQGFQPLYLGLLSCELEKGGNSLYNRQDMLQGLQPLYLDLLSCEVEEGTSSTTGRICYRDYSLCTWACCPLRWRRVQPLPQAGYAAVSPASVPGLAVL